MSNCAGLVLAYMQNVTLMHKSVQEQSIGLQFCKTTHLEL